MKVSHQQIREAANNIFNDSPVQFAYLYGSVAKDIAGPFSDLDIAVYVENLDRRRCLDLELSLSLAMDECLDKAIQSEIRIINHLPLTVQGDILTSGLLIYSHSESKRIDFETRLRMAYFDFLPVIRSYRRGYFGIGDRSK